MSKRVLICDDEPYIVESVSYVVRKAGFDVVTAEDGEQALEAAHREKPDLVFLDIMMPGISGDEVYQKKNTRHHQPDDREGVEEPD